jgi:hypothetical protein
LPLPQGSRPLARHCTNPLRLDYGVRPSTAGRSFSRVSWRPLRGCLDRQPRLSPVDEPRQLRVRESPKNREVDDQLPRTCPCIGAATR